MPCSPWWKTRPYPVLTAGQHQLGRPEQTWIVCLSAQAFTHEFDKKTQTQHMPEATQVQTCSYIKGYQRVSQSSRWVGN